MNEISPMPLGRDGPVYDAATLSGQERPRWAAFGGFTYPAFVMRSLLFHGQHVQGDSDSHMKIAAPFYERHGSLAETYRAVRVNQPIIDTQKGIAGRPLTSVMIEMFPSIYDAPAGVVPLPEADEVSLGAHLVRALSELDCDVLFANNWGDQWGDHGLGWLTSTYLETHLLESWSGRQTPGPDGLGDGFARWRSQLADHPWDWSDQPDFVRISEQSGILVVARWLIGVGAPDRHLQVLAMITIGHEQVIVGWLHARLVARQQLVVEDLFVWPPYRGDGIGTRLLAHALCAPGAAAADELLLLRLDADVMTSGGQPLRWPGTSWAPSSRLGVHEELTLPLRESLGAWADRLPEGAGLRREWVHDRGRWFDVVGPSEPLTNVQAATIIDISEGPPRGAAGSVKQAPASAT